MSGPLSGLDTKRWYLIWIAAALALLLASIVAHEPRYAALSLGGLLFGMGELINHPYREGHGWDRGQRFVISGHPRKPSLLGTIIELIGILVAIFATYRLVF